MKRGAGMFGFGDPLKSIGMGRGPSRQKGFDPRNMGFGDPLKAIENRPHTPKKPSIVQSLMAGLKGNDYGRQR